MNLGSDGIRGAIERFLPLSFKVVNTAAEAFKSAERRWAARLLVATLGGKCMTVYKTLFYFIYLNAFEQLTQRNARAVVYICKEQQSQAKQREI